MLLYDYFVSREHPNEIIMCTMLHGDDVVKGLVVNDPENRVVQRTCIKKNTRVLTTKEVSNITGVPLDMLEFAKNSNIKRLFNGEVLNTMNKTLFSPAQWSILLSLQDSANITMQGPDWASLTNRDRPDYRAAYMEAAEAVGHYGFKWWKKEEKDIEQLKLEIVDILHFLLSEALRSTCQLAIESGVRAKGSELIASTADYLCTSMNTTVDNPSESLVVRLESFMAQTLVFNSIALPEFLSVCTHPELVWKSDDIFMLYLGKNALNLLRTKHGYKQGHYHKIWNGREDNVYLFEIIKKYGTDFAQALVSGTLTAENALQEFLAVLDNEYTSLFLQANSVA